MSTDRLAALLKHAHLRLAAMTDEALAPFGIVGRDWAVLLAVGEGEPPSQQAMARGLGINRQTMVELVDGLETKGLVRRRPHPADRRVNAVELTAAGRKVLRQATTAGDAAAAAFLADLDPAEAGSLTDMLRRLVPRGTE